MKRCPGASARRRNPNPQAEKKSVVGGGAGVEVWTPHSSGRSTLRRRPQAQGKNTPHPKRRKLDRSRWQERRAPRAPSPPQKHSGEEKRLLLEGARELHRERARRTRKRGAPWFRSWRVRFAVLFWLVFSYLFLQTMHKTRPARR